MVVKLRREGADWILPLTKDLVAQMGLGDQTEVEVTVVGRELVISAEPAAVRQDFETALQETNEQFGEALKRLAQ